MKVVTFSRQQVFTLRGLCAESGIDRGYFLVNGRFRESNATLMNPVYEGYFSQIRFNGTGEISSWEISSRLPGDRYSAVTNATSQVGYPVGRHLWRVYDPKCDLFTPTWVNLTLSR